MHPSVSDSLRSLGISAFFIAFTALASPVVALARLGESAQSCVDRYGEPISVNRLNESGPYMDFRANGLIVRCFYQSAEPTSPCEAILYRAEPGGGVVGWDVFERLLQLNAQGSEWGMPTSRTSATGLELTEWRRQDGADAEFYGALMIRSKELNQRRQQEQNKAVDAKTRGF
jgi:hypothetical protein